MLTRKPLALAEFWTTPTLYEFQLLHTCCPYR